VSWTDVGVNDVGVNDVGVKGWTGVGVKGCAMRRSLSVSCEVSVCKMVSSFRLQES